MPPPRVRARGVRAVAIALLSSAAVVIPDGIEIAAHAQVGERERGRIAVSGAPHLIPRRKGFRWRGA